MKWISVDDRMPEENVPVLVVSKAWPDMIETALWAYEDGWHWECLDFGFINDPKNYTWDDDYEFTHWMPLPDPPSVTSDKESKDKEEA